MEASPGPRSRSPSVGSPNGGAGGGGDPSCRVSVAVRIRPLLGQELVDGLTECIVADAYDRKQVRLVAGMCCLSMPVSYRSAPVGASFDSAT